MIRQDWSTLKKLMFMKMAAGGGAAVEATATGNPLNFQTDLARPLKSLLIPFTPVQSGSGDPSPENIRSILPWNGLKVWNGGKNLLDPSALEQGGIDTDGSDTSVRFRIRTGYIPAKENTVYALSAGVGHKLFMHFYDANKGSLGANVDSKSTSPSGACYVRGIIGYTDDSSIAPSELTDGQIEVLENSSETATAYEPYVPITETDIVFPAMGKNLLDPATLEQGAIAEDGRETTNSARVRTGYFPVEAGKKYTLSATGFTGFMHFYDEDKVSIGNNKGMTNVTAPTGSAFVRCFFRNADNTDISPSDIMNPMLEQSSTATSYEPYTNTIYGGTLDVVSGVLTVEWKFINTNSISWTNSSASGRSVFTGTLDQGYGRDLSDSVGIISDSYKTIAQTVSINSMDEGIKGNATFPNIIYVRDTRYESASEFNNNVDAAICYKLAEPYEVQLTGEQITALLGDNTIWSDADGSMTATYLKKG